MVIKQGTMRELALFAGAGGGILGGHILGWRTVCAVERDAYAASILVARQNDKTLPIFPIWSDVTTFNARRWRGRVDIITGGFPCQDISLAGKGAGLDGTRSGLWSEFARIIRDIRPNFVFVENSPQLTNRGLHRVLNDFSKMGYNAKWLVLGADDLQAPQHRKRIWILASDTFKVGRGKIEKYSPKYPFKSNIWQRKEFNSLLDTCPIWQSPKRGFDVMVDGFPQFVDEFAALGNAQVPIVAAAAYSILRSNL